MKRLLMLLAVLLTPVFVLAATGNEQSIINTIKGIHSFVVVIGVLVCVIGFVVGLTKMGAGDEMGKKMAIGALIAALLILLSKPIFNVILDQGKKGQVSNQEVESVFK